MGRSFSDEKRSRRELRRAFRRREFREGEDERQENRTLNSAHREIPVEHGNLPGSIEEAQEE
jgi:hypothetical protein